MFLLFSKKISAETTLTPSQCRSKLNRELVHYTRKPSLVAASSFVKSHLLENCYFGSFDKSGKVEIFYHRAKKHDGASAGFFGIIEKTDNGARISGKIRRSIAASVFIAVWIAATLILTLALLALKIYKGAACMAAVMIIGAGLLLYDGSRKYIEEYLEGFKADE